ncbi:MAG: (2Fe-2S) ferredoxin domain-containing protein, partial [Nitrospirae bacterium]|nr:(2Fe-2S) ferredoxin domain-containing protein [Nitrospirota bacterium]
MEKQRMSGKENQQMDIIVSVCTGSGGVAAGGYKVIDLFREKFKELGLTAEVNKRCGVHKVGCRGFCAKDVLVDIDIKGELTTYQFITPDKVERIVKEHIIEGSPV